MNILIIGGNKGIGRYLSYKFTLMNNKVITVSRTSDFVSRFVPNDFKTEHYNVDIINSKSLNKLFKTIHLNGFYPDLYINSFGMSYKKCSLEKFSKTLWDSFFSLNVKTILSVYQYAKKYNTNKNKFSIINFAGLGVNKSVDGFSVYGLTKTAISRLTESIALEDKSIQINAIGPGLIDTELSKKMVKQNKLNKSNSQENLEQTFKLIYFLYNHFQITGRTISIDDNYHDLNVYENEDLFKLRRIYI